MKPSSIVARHAITRTPLAVATANGAGGAQTLHWLHSTHLGVPVGSYGSTGTATSLTNITLLGFPGQQQTLADLYYNQYRDYDPTTGRYLQADPIGLAGDVNPYVYAGANPVGMVDPLGLFTVLITTYELGVGSHSALFVSRPTPTLYDPGGSYVDNNGGGSGQALFGSEADYRRMIRAYLKSGITVRLQFIATTLEEEMQIARLIDQMGGQSPFFCALAVSSILRSIPDLGIAEPFGLLDSLADRLQVSTRRRVEEVTITSEGEISEISILPIQ